MMGATTSLAGAMIQAKAQKDAARRMMEAQERVVAYSPQQMLGPLTARSSDRKAEMVNCKGCGAPHMTNHFCDYCGGGRPAIPRVRRFRKVTTTT